MAPATARARVAMSNHMSTCRDINQDSIRGRNCQRDNELTMYLEHCRIALPCSLHIPDRLTSGRILQSTGTGALSSRPFVDRIVLPDSSTLQSDPGTLTLSVSAGWRINYMLWPRCRRIAIVFLTSAYWEYADCKSE